MKQPEDYKDDSGKVFRLVKKFYGLKQAPRCWNEKLRFKYSEADSCLFIRRRNDRNVDDRLIVADEESDFRDFINDLRKQFEITSKSASFYLSLKIRTEKDRSIHISQRHYAEKILEKFRMADCRPVTMISDKGNEESPPNLTFLYK